MLKIKWRIINDSIAVSQLLDFDISLRLHYFDDNVYIQDLDFNKKINEHNYLACFWLFIDEKNFLKCLN